MSRILSLLATAACCSPPRPAHAQDDLSEQAGQDHRLPAGRRRRRHRHAHRRREDAENPRTAVRGREQGRRQSGNLGAESVFNAEPDGYTLLASQPAPITTTPLLFKKLNFDPTKFEPVAVMSSIAEHAAGARTTFPAKNVKEFIAYVESQSRQAELRIAGQRHHLASDRRDVRQARRHQDEPRALSAAPAPAMNDLRRRPRRPDLQRARDLDQAAQGRPRQLLAVTTEKRIAELPDVPTMEEAGVPDFISDTWNAISAPPKTPAADRRQAQRGGQPGLKMPEVQDAVRKQHLQVVGGTPETWQDRQGRHRALGRGDQDANIPRI